jgi:hypothetical protein
MELIDELCIDVEINPRCVATVPAQLHAPEPPGCVGSRRALACLGKKATLANLADTLLFNDARTHHCHRCILSEKKLDCVMSRTHPNMDEGMWYDVCARLHVSILLSRLLPPLAPSATIDPQARHPGQAWPAQQLHVRAVQQPQLAARGEWA